jgi:hypothetical protein
LVITFTKNDNTTAYYIEKIKEALSKREKYIKSHTISKFIYGIYYDFNEPPRCKRANKFAAQYLVKR